ncbi:MAG: putative zinc-binding metallopeptidase [Prevotella sp.]|jgi:substrate import-associated zinc metallohydrolase lipoprotein|nr:putative zinc-binding metallopeptidase [Prevotella sp.]
MKIKQLILALCVMPAFVACNEDKLGPSIIEIPEASTNPTDIYIYNNLIVPYNVDVKYKWDYSESDLSKNLVPPREEYIIPFLDAVIQAWINPYMAVDKESDGAFDFSLRVPKQLLLIGSSGYNSDGTVTQGTAEGGKKIVLYEINSYDPKRIAVLQRYFHVMHHEFGHILHQTKEFSTEYQSISAGLYTSTWYLNSDAYAKQNGFITSYAMLEYHEDFVEMVAMMLTRSESEWAALMNSIPASGKTQLLRKESLVISYFKDVWNVNIFELQGIIHERITDYLNGGSGALKSSTNATSDDDYLFPYYSYSQDNTCQYHRRPIAQ